MATIDKPGLGKSFRDSLIEARKKCDVEKKDGPQNDIDFSGLTHNYMIAGRKPQ